MEMKKSRGIRLLALLLIFVMLSTLIACRKNTKPTDGDSSDNSEYSSDMWEYVDGSEVVVAKDGTQTTSGTWKKKKVNSANKVTPSGEIGADGAVAPPSVAELEKHPGKGVTVWGNEDNASLQLAIEAFKAKYPTIEIQRKTAPSGDVLQNVKTAIAADDSPDVVEMDHVYLTSLGMEGYMYNLADFGVDSIKSKFTPSTVEACSYNGKIYGLPTSSNVVANYYNKDIINTHNNGKVPANFQEMLDLGNKLNGLGKKLYSFPFSSDPGGGGKNWACFNFCFFLWSEGGELLKMNSKNQWEAVFNSQAGLEAVNKLKQLKPYMADKYTDGITGDIAMTNMGSWKIASASKPTSNAGVTVIPSTGSSGSFSLLGVYAYGIPIGGKGNKRDAYKFIELYTTNVQCQIRRNTSNPDSPQIAPLIEAQHDKFYTTGDAAPVWQVFFQQMNNVKFRPAIAGWSDIEGYLADAVDGAVLKNQDAQQYLNAAANRANSKLKQIFNY